MLKVAHQGSATSSHPEFLSAASPLIAVVSVGADNESGHPSSNVIAALAAAPNGVFATAQAGDVTLRTDGASWWVETER